MSSASRAVPFWVWLVGRHPKVGTVIVSGALGFLLGGIALSTNEGSWWVNSILFVLAFDLAAGFVSNLSHSTRSFWSSQSFFLRATYVVAHLSFYPLTIWILVSSSVLGGLLALVLAVKILAFVINGFRK